MGSAQGSSQKYQEPMFSNAPVILTFQHIVKIFILMLRHAENFARHDDGQPIF